MQVYVVYLDPLNGSDFCAMVKAHSKEEAIEKVSYDYFNTYGENKTDWECDTIDEWIFDDDICAFKTIETQNHIDITNEASERYRERKARYMKRHSQ